MDEAKKEQIKLTATFMNTVAAGLMVAGVVTPLVALLLGFVSAQVDFRAGLAVLAVCFLGSLSLHLAARMSLRRIGK